MAFGRLLGAANRLEHILGRAIEQEAGTSHLMFEVLLILARAGGDGLSMRAIGREQVRVAHHFVVRGGLIVPFEQFVDTALVRDAMPTG